MGKRSAHGIVLGLSMAALAAIGMGCGLVLGIQDLSSDGGAGSTGTGTPTSTGTSKPCTDTSKDPFNCGGCGHDCGGGACESGVCQPATLWSGAGTPNGIAIDATHVYWTDAASSGADGAVWKVPRGPGKRVNLASGQTQPFYIAVNFDKVFFTTAAGEVVRVGLDGSALKVMLNGQMGPWGIAANASTIFWANNGEGTVWHVGVDGTGQNDVAKTQGGPTGVAIDGTSVYWANNQSGEVMKAPLGGGAPVPLATGQNPGDVAVSSTRVAWTKGSEEVVSADLDGAKPNIFVAPKCLHIAVDGQFIYWTTTSSIMMKANIFGGAGEELSADGATHVAADDKAVVWVGKDAGGSYVRMLVK